MIYISQLTKWGEEGEEEEWERDENSFGDRREPFLISTPAVKVWCGW